MTATYKLHINELSPELINSIKEAFKGKTVSITVSEDIDETDYLLSNEANRQFLEDSESELKAGKGIVFAVEEFKANHKSDYLIN
jgi:hypothetical protein